MRPSIDAAIRTARHGCSRPSFAAGQAAWADSNPARSLVRSTRCRGRMTLHVSAAPACDRSYTSSPSRRRCLTPPALFLSSQRPHRVMPGASGFSRSFATPASAPTKRYEAVVVGAGPAGVTCVGNLLDRKVEPILWVDPEFGGGRVNKMYREVPSNTKVTMFVQFAEAVAPFRKIVSGVPSRSRWEEPSESDGMAMDRQDKLQFMRELDQNKGCDLGLAADMILMLTEGLKRTPGVTAQRGMVSQAILNEDTNEWRLSLDSQTGPTVDVQASRLILCTGSSPTEAELPVPGITHLHLDDALSPTRLSEKLTGLGPTTVAVIGASHSAILVLRNLYNLASTSKPDLKVKWFTRHELRYAEYMDGWILRDNTGLKGEVAVWAKEHLEPDRFPHSLVSKHIEAIPYAKGDEDATFREHLPGSDFVVQAIGYTRDPTPALSTQRGQKIQPTFDHSTGGFTYTTSASAPAKLPGVYGAGIAWPERVTDPHGNVEYAVGFFKFMKFVKRVSPEWN